MSNLSNVPEFRNQVLAKLSFEDLDLLPPHLQPIRLEPIRDGRRQERTPRRKAEWGLYPRPSYMRVGRSRECVSTEGRGDPRLVHCGNTSATCRSGEGRGMRAATARGFTRQALR
jgi:hypothetical protein